MIAQLVTLLAATWLIVSAFMLRHERLEFTVAVTCGLLALCVGTVMRFWRPVRYVNIAVAVTLFSVTAAMPNPHSAMFVSNGVVALTLIATSLLAGRPSHWTTPAHRVDHG